MALINNLSQKIGNINYSLSNNDFIGAFAAKFEHEEDLSNWFFYFDPPYIPKSITSNFTHYNGGGFNYKDQEHLLWLLDIIETRNGKFLLSNSFTHESLQLYQGYDIVEVNASRSINSKANKRKKIKEILVRNY